MTTQLDWVGGDSRLQKPSRAVKNRRKKVQDEKDTLRAELRELTSRAPSRLSDAGVIATRTWLDTQKKALKVMKSERSSVGDLKSAVSAMRAQL